MPWPKFAEEHADVLLELCAAVLSRGGRRTIDARGQAGLEAVNLHVLGRDDASLAAPP